MLVKMESQPVTDYLNWYFLYFFLKRYAVHATSSKERN